MLLAFIAFAAAPRSGVAVEVPPQLAALAGKMRAIQSLQVHMRQEKTLSVFGEVVRAEGSLVFVRPRRLAMDLDGGGGTKLVIDGDSMSIHYKALAKTERMSLARDPRARAVAEHLFLLLDADPQALSETYELTVIGSMPLELKLVPRAEALARLIGDVVVRFDARGFVEELRLRETNDDTTRWLFDDPRINAPVPPERFAMP